MPTLKKALPLILLFAGALFGQGGTAVDCTPTPFTFTSATTGAAISNANTATPCASWRVTYNSTGFSALSIQLETSPDNSSWTAVTNTVCSSSVQPPCVIDGANPTTTTTNATFSVRAYGRYVRLNVTSVTGSGTITARVYGYKGLSAQAGTSSGGGGGGSGTVTSVTIAGATNQLGVSGTCTGTTIINCTLQFLNAAATFPASGSWSIPGSYSAGVGGTNSGAMFVAGVTDAKAQGFSVNDTAGVSILYLMPSAAGAANQVLRDSGAVTCPTLAAGAPAVCHQLIWSAATGVGAKIVSAVSLPPSQPETCTDVNGDLTTSGCGAGSNTGNSVTSTTPVTKAVNTTGDQQLMELSLSAGYLNTAGQPFQITGAGIYSTVALQTPTLEFKVKLCTVSGCGSGTVVTLVDITSTATIAGNANNNWFINFLAATSTTGASGKLEIHGPATVDLGATTATADAVFGDLNTAASSAIDLTGALFLDFTLAFSTNTASPNSVTQRLGGIMPYAASTGGGGGTPGGSNGQLQYNNSGAFGGVGSPMQPNLSTTGAPVASLPTSGWTIRNGAILNDFSNGFTQVRAIDNGAVNFRGITRTISVPYTIYASVDCYPTLPYTSSQTCGFAISDGTKYETFEFLFQTNLDIQLETRTTANVTTGGTIITGPTTGVSTSTMSVKLTNNSTNRVFSYWSNGAWVQFQTEASGTFLTETSAGLLSLSLTSNAAKSMDMKLTYWSVQ